jgi:hypothetical protein
MFQGSLHIWSIRGIPIRIHFTWLIIFGLLSWTLASGYFPQHYPDLPIAAYWLIGGSSFISATPPSANSVIPAMGTRSFWAVQARCASPAADSHAGVERRVGSDVPHLVSRLPGPRHAPGRVISPTWPCGVCPALPLRYRPIRAGLSVASVCAPPIGAFVVERLGHTILHSSRISLGPPLPPLMCTSPTSVRTTRL